MLEKYFETPTSASVCITPPGSKGFPLRFDNAGVFWVVYIIVTLVTTTDQ